MDWIEFGYMGMFFSAILAATLLPFGSEAIFLGLMYSGFAALPLIIVASIGNTIGGMITYYIGRLGKWDWLEKWFKIPRKTIEKYMDAIKKYGGIFAFFTWLPIIGDPLAAAIGFARISPFLSLSFMLIGKTFRFCLLALTFNYGLSMW